MMQSVLSNPLLPFHIPLLLLLLPTLAQCFAACRLPLNKSSAWAACQCHQENGNDGIIVLNAHGGGTGAAIQQQQQLLQQQQQFADSIRLSCDDTNWSELPELDAREMWSDAARDGGRKDGERREQQQQHLTAPPPPPSIGAIRIRNSRIVALGQDAFRAESGIQLLDLAQNAIQLVNANAFRGLEAQLSQLDLSGNRLAQIPSWSLTYLRQLHELRLDANRIGQIDANCFAETHLPNLRYLHLNRNNIVALENGSLARLPALQVLTLASNHIKRVSAASLPRSLWFLDLKNNLLEQIPFAALSGLGALRVLDLERNNISELTSADGHHKSGGEGTNRQIAAAADGQQTTEAAAAGIGTQFASQQQQQQLVTELAELDLRMAHNRIRVLTEGAFDGFRRFSTLDLSHNQINSINEKAFRSVQSLTSLDLGSNSLAQIPQNTFLRFAHSLQRLNLQQNHFFQLPAALRPLIGIQQLNLEGNQLTGMDETLLKGLKANLSELLLTRNVFKRVPSEALQGMISLRSLDLSRNQIGRIGKMAFGSSDALGSNGVSPLQRLNLAGNRIRELAEPGAFLYLAQLTRLDLSHNQIHRLSKATFERLEALEWLSLDHNQMLEFPRNALSSLTRLRQFSMESNRLALLPNYAFQWLVHLQRLSLARNRVHTLNAKTFHSTSAIQIKWLSLAHNRISRMETAAFQNLPNLEQLFLHHNRLTVLQTQIISSLKNLRHLTLAHNLINETQESAFANLPQLESLSLAHNRLRTIKEGVFHKVPSLARLDLRHNRIEAFDLDFLGASVHQLRLLDLSHNVIRKLEIQPAKSSLQVLNLRNNQLEFVHGQMLQGFEQLRHVDLSHNDLIELNFAAFWGSIRLERIVLAENNLRHIWKDTFRDQLQITLLDLSGNVLHALEPDIFGRDNLLELDLSRNNFSAIPTRALTSVGTSLCRLVMSRNGLNALERRSFEGMQNLSELVLAHNRIETLNEETFALLPRLRRLDLSGNPVSSWSPHTFLGLSPAIVDVSFANAGLFSLPRLRAPFLRLLNLSGNFLYELMPTDLDTLPALQSLDLSHNRLVEIQPQLLEQMPELRMLNLSGNALRSLDVEVLGAMGQLEVLALARMPALVQLPDPSEWSRLSRLHSLELHSLTNITQLDLAQILHFLPPLHALHFESPDEQFTGTELAKADLRLLRELTIAGPAIRRIDPNAFTRLRGFRLHLSITGTKLRDFPAQALTNLRGIAFLRLSLVHNQIRSLDLFGMEQRPPVLNQQGTILETLNLQDNPLECDCRLRWLVHWLAAQAGSNDQQASPAAELLAHSQCASSDGRQWRLEQEWPPPRPGAQKKTLNLLEWTRQQQEEERGSAAGGGGRGGGGDEAKKEMFEECRIGGQQTDGATGRGRMIERKMMTMIVMMMALRTLLMTMTNFWTETIG